MDVKIGVTDSPRELILSSAQTPAEVEKLVSDALEAGSGVLALTDEKGRRYLVQAARIAYVEIGAADAAPGRLRGGRRRRGSDALGGLTLLRAVAAQERVSGTCDSPPQMNCTVPSTASSLAIGRSLLSQ